jgi:hypothetical protein
MVAVIHDPNMDARSALLADSRAGDLCESDELFAESFTLTGFQGPARSRHANA